MSDPLPEFGRPPLSEVAIGIQFDPIPGFRAAHLGSYWSRIRDRYPHTQDLLPLLPQKEPEGIGPQAQFFTFQDASVPRCWFIDKTAKELIQLQSDRFLRNWRTLEGTLPYPRYSHLMGEFRKEWENFLDFVIAEKLPVPVANQCELTYVNSIERGIGWQDYTDLGNTFGIVRPKRESRFLPSPELFSWETRYKLPENRGRLHVQMQPVFRQDFKVALSFTLTARGAPANEANTEVFRWFDLAHEWIVKAFDELTEPAMHSIWMKKS